ncbi:hypothetical protein ACIQKE_18260 [Streptomyces griseoviridis]|uniref:hypothetical protein n=1 Tax=Streptomyces griseoviridis TaxID=45398 RepID=UPI003421515B
MAPMSDHLTPLRAVRQLRRVRAFYAVGIAVWAASTAWSAWQAPGSRQMWVSALLLVVFTGLLLTAALWTRSLERARPARPTHHAAPRPRGARPGAVLRTH